MKEEGSESNEEIVQNRKLDNSFCLLSSERKRRRGIGPFLRASKCTIIRGDGKERRDSVSTIGEPGDISQHMTVKRLSKI